MLLEFSNRNKKQTKTEGQVYDKILSRVTNKVYTEKGCTMKRGRPKQDKHRSEVEIFKLYPEEKILLIKKIKKSGMNKSEFIRSRILADPDEVIITFGNN